MPAGRPVEYNEDVLKRTGEYILKCQDTEREIMNGDKLTTRTVVNLPSIEGLAVYLGIARETVYDWSRKYPEFSDIIKTLLAEQAKRLVNNGLSGDYNSTIAKLILTKHGYTDKQDITTDGKPLNLSFDPTFNAPAREAEGNSGESGQI